MRVPNDRWMQLLDRRRAVGSWLRARWYDARARLNHVRLGHWLQRCWAGVRRMAGGWLARRRVDGRWWAALVVILAFVLVARTGTVGAPAQAGAPHVEPAATASNPDAVTVVTATQRIEDLEIELRRARMRARLERDRNARLEESHAQLEGEVARIRERLRTEHLRAEQLLAVPVPVEAIYTTETPSEAPSESK